MGPFVGYPNLLSHGGDYGGKVQGLATGTVTLREKWGRGLPQQPWDFG